MARAAGVVGLLGARGERASVMAGGGKEGSATDACVAGVDCRAGKAGGSRGGGGVPVARFEVEE